MNQRKSIPDRILNSLRPAVRIAVFGVLVMQLQANRWGYVYLCAFALILFELPGWADRLGICLPKGMEMLILLFLVGSVILGEIEAWYVRIPWWDGLLHGVSGFLVAAAGFALPELPGGQGSGKMVRALFALCFSMTVGVLWEFLEWGVDCVFGLDMQKDTVITALHSVCLDPMGGNCTREISGIRDAMVVLSDGTMARLELGGYLDVGLHDTMGDLLVNLAGAMVLLLFTMGEGRLAKQFLPTVEKSQERQ